MDNSTAESCVYRGSFSSPLLHNLILRMRIMELKFNLIIHIVHVSRKRMIAQETDGCSQGFLLEGMMSRRNMLSFVDLVHSAIKWHRHLLDWIWSWKHWPELEPLSIDKWFVKRHGTIGGQLDRNGARIPNQENSRGLHMWSPPPALADLAFEELLNARHKWNNLFHIVLISCLFIPRWRYLMNKVCDFSCIVSLGVSFWLSNIFELLWLDVILLFNRKGLTPGDV